MRATVVSILALCVAASPAWAQDAPPATESAHVATAPLSSATADELMRRGDDLARLRGRGTMRAAIGGVMLGLGLILGGVSTVLWISGDSATGYLNAGFNAYYQGAVAMDTIAFGLIGGGTTLLAIGAGNIAESKRPRLFIGAASIGAHF